MELFIVLIWILLAFAIPLILIVISGFKYARQESIAKISLNFFVALLIYIPFTIFAVFFFGGFLDAVVHEKNPHVLGTDIMFRNRFRLYRNWMVIMFIC